MQGWVEYISGEPIVGGILFSYILLCGIFKNPRWRFAQTRALTCDMHTYVNFSRRNSIIHKHTCALIKFLLCNNSSISLLSGIYNLFAMLAYKTRFSERLSIAARKVRRCQRGNRKSYIEEGQT